MRHLLSCFAALFLLIAPVSAPAQEEDLGESFEKPEIVQRVAEFFGITAEAAGTIVEKVFEELGEPNAYIEGEEFSGAVGVGLRYGKGELKFKSESEKRVSGTVFWRGPSVGFDVGGNASKTFTLVYNLQDTERLFQRFPGVEGSAYFVAGVGVNYQRAASVTLVPMRAGVGYRVGANIGYLAYSKTRKWLPL